MSKMDPLFQVAGIRALSTWLKHNEIEWVSLGWSDVHAKNLMLYLDSIRNAAGFPGFPGVASPPEFDGFWRSRQSRIKQKVAVAKQAWVDAGSPGFEKAYDYELSKVMDGEVVDQREPKRR